MGAIEEYRARRAKRLAERFGATRLDKKDNVAEYKRRRAARLKARGYRADAPYQEPTDQEIQQLQKSRGGGGSKGGGGHGNTRLPFGLCKRFGIDIDPSWTPRDAWDALAGKGITPDGAYGRLKRGEDPGTPDKGEEKTPEVTKKPVNSIKMGEYSDAEYKHLKASKRTWGVRKGDDKWSLAGDMVEGSGGGGYAPKMMRRTFKTKTDIFAFLKEHGVEEFEDPETGEVVNPKEMEIPKSVFKLHGSGYPAVALGMRDGRYVITGTDYDGEKTKFYDFRSLADAKKWYEEKGGNWNDVKMTPALKKREKERTSWLDSDKKEYFEDGGVKYGDIKIFPIYDGYTLTGESEDGKTTSMRFHTRHEAMKYLKEQGVQKVKDGGGFVNPQEYEPPKTIATTQDGRELAEVRLGLEPSGGLTFYGKDLDGREHRLLSTMYGEDYGSFMERVKQYGNDIGATFTKDTITIADKDKAELEKRERWAAEFAEKAEDFGGTKYADVKVEKDDTFGEVAIYGRDISGRTRCLRSSDWYDVSKYFERAGKNIENYLKDDGLKKDYEDYKKSIAEFETKAVEIAGNKYADVKISFDRGMGRYEVKGVDPHGRRHTLIAEPKFSEFRRVLNQYGFSEDSFPTDDDTKERIEKAKKRVEFLKEEGAFSFSPLSDEEAYKDIEVAKTPFGWGVYGTDMDGNKKKISDFVSHGDYKDGTWESAMDIMERFHVTKYTVKDGSGTVLGMPKIGIRSAVLKGEPGGGFTVYAKTEAGGKYSSVHKAKSENEAREWLKNNSIPDEVVKTRSANPNDDVTRTHTEKSLAKFDEHRGAATIGTFIDDMTEEEKQDACSMLTELFTQGKPRAFRGMGSMFGLLTDGYKSQIEIGHGGAAAANDLRKRKETSKTMYGHSGLAKSEYEKYGFLGSSDENDDWESGIDAYGGRCPILYTFKKDNLNDRMTYTYGDSLNVHSRHGYAGGPEVAAGYGGSKPTIDGLACAGTGKSSIEGAIRAYKKYKEGMLTFSEFREKALERANNRYLELQLHGDVTAKDIESMGFKNQAGLDRAFRALSGDERKKAFESIKNNGITIYYREHGKNIDAKDYLRKMYGADL